MSYLVAGAAAVLVAVLVWSARRNYLWGKTGAKTPGQLTLAVSLGLSFLAFFAFEFVILRRAESENWDGFVSLAGGLISASLLLNVMISAHFLGVVSKDPNVEPSSDSAKDRHDQAHA